MWLVRSTLKSQELFGDGSRQVLVLYRKRDETRGVRKLGVIARFRYNDLKEAAVVAADAGAMQIEWSGGVACRCAGVVRRSTTADTMGGKAGYDERMLWKECLKKPEEEICSAISQEATDPAETREGFELERVASCCSREHRWRTKLDFSSGESFDDHHRATTIGAAPEIARVVGARAVLFGRRSCSRAEQLKTEWQVGGTFAIGQEAEVSDAHEPFGEQMQQEAAQELIDRKRQRPLFIVVGGIAPTKRYRSVSKRDQAMVGDGHAMGITAQITEHMLWASERTFRVDHPVLSEQRSQPRGERL